MQLSWWFSVAFFCPHGYTNAIETGLYYLQSRYYNPEWGRFVNADNADTLATSPGHASWDKNLFAYCDNNPVTRRDDGGLCWDMVVGAVLGFGVELADQLWRQGKSLSDVDWQAVALATAGGMLSGLIGGGASFIAKKCGKLMKPVIKAVGNGVGNVVDGWATGKVCSLSDTAKTFAKGVVSAGISEGTSTLTKTVHSNYIRDLPSPQKKDYLTNKVFKSGNYYYSWNQKTYTQTDRYNNYIDRIPNAISVAVSAIAKWLNW